jgi:hypothetical protein
MVLNQVNNVLGFLNENTFFAGIMLLLLNVGSRFIVHEFSADDKEYRENILIRRLCVFAVCFVGTKDVLTSIILTAGFVILAGGLFRGKGPESKEGMSNMVQSGAISTFGSMNDPSPPIFKEDENK